MDTQDQLTTISNQNEELENKKVIILLEDEFFLRKVFTEVLVGAGYAVKQGPDPIKGMELIQELNWDLLLLDVMLPVKDGITMLREIEQKSLKKGKIVMLTNLNNENIIKDAFKYGADGYLIKSDITPGNLVTEVNNFLK